MQNQNNIVQYNAVKMTRGLSKFQAFSLFLFVFLMGASPTNPSLYDVFFFVILTSLVYKKFYVSRYFAAPLVLIMLYIISGNIGITQYANVYYFDPKFEDAPNKYLSLLITTYISFTFFLYALFVYNFKDRAINILTNALYLYSVLSVIIGALGFFKILPYYESVTWADRLISTMKDPNAYGQYLIISLLYGIYKVYSTKYKSAIIYLTSVIILLFGVFLTFSRAAWGSAVFGILLFTVIYYIQSNSILIKRRVLFLFIAFAIFFSALIFALLSISSVSDLFFDRAVATKEYDLGRYGRLSRHWLGFMDVLGNPLGSGFYTFPKYYTEATHNEYLYAFWNHGWVGGISYLLFVVLTLFEGVKVLFKKFDTRPILLIVYICFLIHVINSWIIDIHHWRHYYYLLGIIWGYVALSKSGKLNIIEEK